MATRTIFLSGTAKWAKLNVPDKKYNYYGLDLYLDEESTKTFHESGLQVKKKTGEDGDFYSFRRDAEKLIKSDLVKFDPPELFDGNNNKMVDDRPLIGNGSKVTCKIATYDTVKGIGHRLESVRIDELVEYEGEPPEDTSDHPF